MKVLHLNDHYQKVGGAEMILFRTLEALEQVGITNAVVHHHPIESQEVRRQLYQVPDLGSFAPRRKGTMIKRLKEIVEKERPDVIHIHDVGEPSIPDTLSHLRPTVQSVFNHSFYCPGGLKYLPLARRVCQRKFGVGCLASAFLTHCNSIRPHILFHSYNRSRRTLGHKSPTLFLALSQFQMQCLIQNGCSPKTVRVLPPFTTLPERSDAETERTDTPILLFSGRLVPGKGFKVLLQVLRQIKSNFELVVDGAGAEREEAQKLSRQLGLQDRVRFIGWAPPDRHWACFRQASIVVVPSIWPEPFGMVGIEAMSYAKPVVAFRVGAIPEWLENDVTGFLIQPGDLAAMAEKIDFLLQNPSIARQMGQEGRQQVEQRFTPRQYVPKLLEIYREVMESWDPRRRP